MNVTQLLSDYQIDFVTSAEVQNELIAADKAGVMDKAYCDWLDATPALKSYLGWSRAGQTFRLTRPQRIKLFPILHQLYTENRNQVVATDTVDYETLILNRQEANSHYW